MILRLESAEEHHRIWWLMIIFPIKMTVLEIPYIFRQTHMELLPSLNVILLMSHPLKAVIRLQSPPPAKSATDVCMNLVQWRKSTEFHSVPPQTHLMLETAAQRHRIFLKISTWKKNAIFSPPAQLDVRFAAQSLSQITTVRWQKTLKIPRDQRS